MKQLQSRFGIIRVSRLAVASVAVALGLAVLLIGLLSAPRERGLVGGRGVPALGEVTPDFLDPEIVEALRERAKLSQRFSPDAKGYDFLNPGEVEKEKSISKIKPVRPRYASRKTARRVDESKKKAYEAAVASSIWASEPEEDRGSLAQTWQGVDRQGMEDVVTHKPLLKSPGEFTIMKGTLLPALLITPIRSDVPGDITAQVSRDVYDHQQRFVLIPAGSRLVGTYDNQVAYGQGRLLVAWTRLILPDGKSMDLPGLPGHGKGGMAGVEGKVNKRFWARFGPAILVSAISAALRLPGALLQRQGTTNVTIGLGTASQAAGELSAAARLALQSGQSIYPRIDVAAGFPIAVFVAEDLAFDTPYEHAGEGNLARFVSPVLSSGMLEQ